MNFAGYLKLALYLSGIGLLGSCSSKLPSDVSSEYKKLPEHIDFNFDVKPILSDRCFSCHGPDEKARQADLRLDQEEMAFGVLPSGAERAFVAKKPGSSLAIQRILSEDPEFMMPPPDSKLNLTPKEKAVLVKWVEEGAEWKDHWSFSPPQKAALPDVSDPDWCKNPIDHFILARLDQEQMEASAMADKNTLIRRVTLDLIGLPPTPDEVQAFLADNSPQAYERLIDRLLQNPKFGERWCWDWLDAARYADTNGFQGDPTRSMWPWRDWVIDAINDNMPYDQFTVEQLAGDLLPDASTEQVLATGFNRNHMYNGEGGRIPEETRVENVFDRVETLGTVWLGLTLTCSRCHDHKFDPITQKEYYQFYDYFNQTSEEGLNHTGRVEPVLDLSPPIEQAKLREYRMFLDKLGKEMEQYESELFPHEEGQTPADSPNAIHLNGDDAYALTIKPSKRNSYLTGLLSTTFKPVNPEYSNRLDQLKKAKDDHNRQLNANLRVMVMDQLDNKRQSYILDRGIYNKQLEKVSMDVPAVLPSLPEGAPANRLTLAEWVVSPEHPLTARVTVNRFWQSLFGVGLVKTPEDFGVQGAKPSHPQLLDWLAVSFVENGWNVKELLKSIMMSATYRQKSKVSPELLEKDPENRFLARAPRYRLPSWMIRDQALYLSGLLNDSIGGPSVKPYQPEGVWEEATFGFKKYVQDHGSDLYRRTLYTFWRRIVGPTMLFDNSARQVCSVDHKLTNTPSHALTTLNDVTYVEAARVMAERIMLEKEKPEERLDLAFRMATARSPNLAEKAILMQRIQQLKKEFEEKPEDAKKLVTVGEYRQNDALDPVEQATYLTLCSTILNLDETITKQ